MRLVAKDESPDELMRYSIRVDGVTQKFVLWFDTKEKVAECVMFTGDGWPVTGGYLDQYQTGLEDVASYYTIHRFDVYYDNELIESVK